MEKMIISDCLCTRKTIYMCISHEMMSNSKLCQLASNPYTLPTTIRENKDVPNIISTLDLHLYGIQ